MLVILIKTFKKGISTIITRYELGWFSRGQSHIHMQMFQIAIGLLFRVSTAHAKSSHMIIKCIYYNRIVRLAFPLATSSKYNGSLTTLYHSLF